MSGIDHLVSSDFPDPTTYYTAFCGTAASAILHLMICLLTGSHDIPHHSLKPLPEILGLTHHLQLELLGELPQQGQDHLNFVTRNLSIYSRLPFESARKSLSVCQGWLFHVHIPHCRSNVETQSNAWGAKGPVDRMRRSLLCTSQHSFLLLFSFVSFWIIHIFFSKPMLPRSHRLVVIAHPFK